MEVFLNAGGPISNESIWWYLMRGYAWYAL